MPGYEVSLDDDGDFDSDISTIDEKLPIVDMASRSPSPLQDFVDENIIEPEPQEWFVKKEREVKIENFDSIETGPAEGLSKSFMVDHQPIDYFNLLIDDDVFESISLMTNNCGSARYGRPSAFKKPKYLKWLPTNASEMKEVFALFAYMSLVKMPKCGDYWATDDVFSQRFPPSVMSRNRFLQLKVAFEVRNNSVASNMISSIVYNFQKYYKPSEKLDISDTLIVNNSGTKILFLCTDSGYTYNAMLTSGLNFLGNGIMVSEKSITKLCEPIMGKGHTVYMGDMCTSIPLAEIFLKNNTHLVGMLHKERKGIPEVIIEKNLEVGEFISRVNGSGIRVMRWYDDKDSQMLSTKHTDKIVEVKPQKFRGTNEYLPEMFVELIKMRNVKNCFYPCTDSLPVHRGTKWCKRIIIEFIINHAMHNAYILYSEVNKDGMNSVEFRKAVVRSLAMARKSEVVYLEDPIATVSRKRVKHELLQKEGSKRTTRKRCVSCYFKNSREKGSKVAKNNTVQVSTYCDDCENKPHLCLSCFNELHRE